MTAERRNRLLFSRSLKTCLFAGVLSAGCSRLHLPPNPPQFSLSEGRELARDGIDLRATPVQGRELNWEVFDENMPALGIAPVWVEVKNNRSVPLDLPESRWRLRVDGKSFKTMSSREVLERYYAGRRTRMYSTGTEAAARTDLERLTLTGDTVAPTIKHEGFLFFRIDPRLSADWAQRAVLVARGVRLDRHTTIDIELPLQYANP
jgi:hypothetical protein